MNSIIKEVKLGFSQETEVYTIYAKQNDSQRIINFELIDESNNYIIEDVTAIYFCETLSDGTVITPIKIYPAEENNISLESGSIVTLQFTSDMTKVPGLAHCELLFVQSDEPLTIENNQIIGEYETLTTQTFNLYIESSVSNGTKTHTKSSTNDLIKLIIATQQLNDRCSAFEYGGTYTDSTGEHTITYENSREGQEGIRIGNESTRINNESTRVTNEETRVSNETTRQANETIRVGNEATRVSNEEVRVGNETTRITAETERVRAEKERKAFESAGTYIDTEGESYTIAYKDSRVGASERERALLYGGAFTDIDGIQKSVSNQYEYGGQQYDANVSDLGGKSLMAIGASTHKAALDTKRWADATEYIYESLGGATLNLQSNVTASQILDSTDPNYIDVSIVNIGNAYFTSEQFVTDNNFAEGAGVTVTIGSEIYVNKNHKWDIIPSSAFAQDMRGATSSTAGVHGLVPAPAVGDEEKVLSGAGTWIEVKSDPTYLCDSVEDTDVCTEIHTANETIYVKSEDVIVQTMTALAIGDNIITSGENQNAFIRDFKGEGYQSVTSGVASHAEGFKTTASGDYSHSEGDISCAMGDRSHAEGSESTAIGDISHAEGNVTIAQGVVSHTEGSQTTAAGFASHAEGYYTSAVGNYSHAEGICTSSAFSKVIASGDGSHAEGCRTTASEFASHAEGFLTSACGTYAHAEGCTGNNDEPTIASGKGSHAEGCGTTASGIGSHSEGILSVAIGQYTHAEGWNTTAFENYSHAEGCETSVDGNYAHAEGYKSMALVRGSHAEGNSTTTYHYYAHAEGNSTYASSTAAHAEGDTTTADGISSHAEGIGTYAKGNYSHAEGCNTSTSNKTVGSSTYSHAEGYATIAAGTYSHAEGANTTAAEGGMRSHSEGVATITIGVGSHAEGLQTTARGYCSHTEGMYTSTNQNYNPYNNGHYSHAEGLGTTSNPVVAGGDGAHAEGYCTTSLGLGAHSEGYQTSVTGYQSHAEGYQTSAIGTGNPHASGVTSGHFNHAEGVKTLAGGGYSHSEGYYTTTTGMASHSEGYTTIAYGTYSHAEGGETTAYGSKSHAEGQSTYAIDSYSHAEGNQSSAVGVCSHTEGSQTEAFHYSHAEGLSTRADGLHSHAEGLLTTASSDSSHAEGEGTCAAAENQHVSGKYNSPNADTTNRFIIGKGASRYVLANSFRVNDSGVYGSGAYNSSGADYAEMFEWNDGNPNNEDRRGLFVTLKGDKIEKANSRTKFILGVISGNPSVVGDVHDDQWNGMFEKDIFGTDIYEDVEVPDVTTTTINPETGEEETVVVIPAHVEHRQKLNPNYDSTQTYIPRSKRPEWNYVGMMGKLVVVDDGTCEIDGYCKSGNKGVATKSDTETKFRVMKRLDDTHIQVLVI